MKKLRPKGFFVTGTDTGVGKTIIAGALIRELMASGLRVGAMKPVESGCRRHGGVLIPSDGNFLKDIACMTEDIRHITPYALEAPLAPLAAAELEDVNIEPEVIRQEFHRLVEKYEAMVVEGVGGLLVPIRKDYFVLDMARDLGLPLVVVTRPVLGTINHTLLTVRYAIEEGLEVAGVVINQAAMSSGSLAERTNPEVLGRLLPVPVLGVFPHLAGKSAQALDRAAAGSLDHAAIGSILFGH
jgi:dethiobiotin synthetase